MIAFRLKKSSGLRVVTMLALLSFPVMGGCFRVETTEASVAPLTAESLVVSGALQEPITPLPQTVSLDARKVALGQRLFNDPLLSHDQSISCVNCHSLALGGTDRRPRSVGFGGRVGRINAPTVFNSGLNFRQFWDGHAETLEAQVDGPLQSPEEMGSTWEEVLARLRRDPGYASAFKSLYPGGIEPRYVRDAIAEFERSLVTPNARFDRYLRGEKTALTAGERAGYAKFKSYGCVSCHQGVNVGANMFQRMGAIGDYFADRGQITAADFGRFNATGNEADRYFFKVPSLRNVALTAPYFHDASAPTLEVAVTLMAKYQLGRTLPPEDLAEIVQFLKTLTGTYEGRPL
jgi:cytochrome c peroxidase